MISTNTTGAAAGRAGTTPVLSLAQVERRDFKQQQWFDRLKRSTGCDLLAPIKLLVRSLGGGAPQTIRNNGNRVTISGEEIQGYLVGGRVVFDLLQIAGALATAEIFSELAAAAALQADFPAARPARGAPGRPRKAGLSLSGSAA